MHTRNSTGGNGPKLQHGRFITDLTEECPLEGIIKTAESSPLELDPGTHRMKPLLL